VGAARGLDRARILVVQMIGPMAAMSCIICHRLLVAARRGQKKPHERLRAVEFGVDLRRGTEVLDVTGHTFFHCSADGAASEVDGFPDFLENLNNLTQKDGLIPCGKRPIYENVAGRHRTRIFAESPASSRQNAAASGVSDVKASRNHGNPQVHPHRGERRTCTGPHPLRDLGLDSVQSCQTCREEIGPSDRATRHHCSFANRESRSG